MKNVISRILNLDLTRYLEEDGSSPAYFLGAGLAFFQGRLRILLGPLLIAGAWLLGGCFIYKIFQILLDFCFYIYSDFSSPGFIRWLDSSFFRYDPWSLVLSSLVLFYCLFWTAKNAAAFHESFGESLLHDIGAFDISACLTDYEQPKGRYILEKTRELAKKMDLACPKIYLQPDEQGINSLMMLCGQEPILVLSWGTAAYLQNREIDALLNSMLRRLAVSPAVRQTKVYLWLSGLYTLRYQGSFLMSNSAALYCPKMVGGLVWVIGLLTTLAARPVMICLGRLPEKALDEEASEETGPGALAELLRKIGSVSRKNGRQRIEQAGDLGPMYFAPPRPFGLLNSHCALEKRIRHLDPGWDGQWPKLSPPPRQMTLGSNYF
jgi:hypothetical protein